MYDVVCVYVCNTPNRKQHWTSSSCPSSTSKQKPPTSSFAVSKPTHVYVCMSVCMYVCVYVCVCMHVCMHACTYSHTRTYTQTCIIYVCMYTSTYTWYRLPPPTYRRSGNLAGAGSLSSGPLLQPIKRRLYFGCLRAPRSTPLYASGARRGPGEPQAAGHPAHLLRYAPRRPHFAQKRIQAHGRRSPRRRMGAPHNGGSAPQPAILPPRRHPSGRAAAFPRFLGGGRRGSRGAGLIAGVCLGPSRPVPWQRARSVSSAHGLQQIDHLSSSSVTNSYKIRPAVQGDTSDTDSIASITSAAH